MYSNLLDNTLRKSDGKWIYPALLYFIQNLLTYSTYFEHKTRVYSYSHIYIQLRFPLNFQQQYSTKTLETISIVERISVRRRKGGNKCDVYIVGNGNDLAVDALPRVVFQGGLAADESCNQKVIIHGYLGALQLSEPRTRPQFLAVPGIGATRGRRQWRCFILISLPMLAPYSFSSSSPSPPSLPSSARETALLPPGQFSTIHTRMENWRNWRIVRARSPVCTYTRSDSSWKFLPPPTILR